MTGKLRVRVALHGNNGETFIPNDNWSACRALLMELATKAARDEQWSDRWMLHLVYALATLDIVHAEYGTDTFSIAMAETAGRLLSCWLEHHCGGYRDVERYMHLSVDDAELTRLCRFLLSCDGFTVGRDEGSQV